MNLEIGKRYLTREGDVVKIIANVADIPGADPKYPCIGIFESDGILRRFSSNGDGNSVSSGSYLEDLVSEYVEPIKINPPRYQYIAMDVNKRWYLYTTRPVTHLGTWGLPPACGDGEQHSYWPTPPAALRDIPWEKSLHRIEPDGTLVRETA